MARWLGGEATFQVVNLASLQTQPPARFSHWEFKACNSYGRLTR